MGLSVPQEDPKDTPIHGVHGDHPGDRAATSLGSSVLAPLKAGMICRRADNELMNIHGDNELHSNKGRRLPSCRESQKISRGGLI